MIQFIFSDLSSKNTEALRAAFGNLPNFEFHRQNITDIAADVIVSPANSYGMMDGGVDKAINYSLNYISKNVKHIIETQYQGEQPVGTCILLSIPQDDILVVGKYKYLAHTPTMRVPKNVSETDNAYLAFRALLVRIINHNKNSPDKIGSIVLTSFCTGAGGMSSKRAAKQMRLAYDMVTSGLKCSWKNAHDIERSLSNIGK